MELFVFDLAGVEVVVVVVVVRLACDLRRAALSEARFLASDFRFLNCLYAASASLNSLSMMLSLSLLPSSWSERTIGWGPVC